MRAAGSVDEYLTDIPDDKRSELERLRGLIRSVAPDAVETIAYAMPAYRLQGRYFLGFSATKTECSFYVGRGPVDLFATELAPYRRWKGTINYRATEPLPADLVRRIVEARLAEFRQAG